MIKKYWQYVLIGLLVIIVSFAVRSCAERDVKYIAARAAAEAEAKNNKKANALLDAYRQRNSKLEADLAKVGIVIENTNVKVGGFVEKIDKQRKEILKLQDYKEQAIQLNLRLVATQEFILTLKLEYNKNITDLDESWRAIHENDKSQIKAITDLYGALNAEYGKLVKDVVVLRLRASRRLNLGFFAGYSVGGNFVAGLGITFDLIEIPVKVF